MKTPSFLLLSFLISSLVTTAFAKTDSMGFMTPRDIFYSDAISNINLLNHKSTAVTVYGLYVRELFSVAPGDTCNHSSPLFLSTNVTAGSFVMPTNVTSGKSAAIGSNFLYNMLYQALNYAAITNPSPPCQLPGCTWGNDSTKYNWCIYLGASAPVTTSSGYTSTVPPSAETASSGSYNYNLISNGGYVFLGPISCNDQTLSCTVANPQTQSFS